MPKKVIVTIIILIAILLGGFFYAYQSGYLFPNYLTIFHAGSLSVPLQKIGEEFSHKHPRIRIAFESSGSVDAVRKITDLNKSCDVLAVADWILIPKMMYDKHASWVIIFASNEMVIAYTDKSKYSNEIEENPTDWYKILSRDDVTIGRSDPNCDPCGYRALMVFQLASIYYSDPSINTTLWEHENTIVKPKSVELLALLEAGQLDYAFEYKSVAVQHNLNYLELPDYINLGNDTSFDVGNTLTIEAWIKPTDLSGRFGIFSTRWNNSPGAFQLEVGTTDNCVNGVTVSGLLTWVARTEDNVISLNEWTHIAYVKIIILNH